MHLHDRWTLPAAPDLRDALLTAYAEPSRHYHDTRHLGEVLERLDELRVGDGTPGDGPGATYDRVPVVLAAWFHDGVYDGERDAEERSAVWAEDALVGLVDDDVRAEVARLVRLTETHQPADDDRNGCALSDADLAILAAPPTRYAQYVAAVRDEYAHLDDDLFRAGRAHLLEGLADKAHLFHSPLARERWELAARDNLTREICELRGA